MTKLNLKLLFESQNQPEGVSTVFNWWTYAKHIQMFEYEKTNKKKHILIHKIFSYKHY